MVKVSTLNKSLHAVYLWLFSNLKNFHSEVREESEKEAFVEEFLSIGSNSSAAWGEIIDMKDNIKEDTDWDTDTDWNTDSDPNLEERFMDMFSDAINNSHEISGVVGRGFGQQNWSQGMIDRIGGRGTLGGIWCQLKEM